MSYCRIPYMIYPTKNGVRFNLTEISNDEVDVFLYKILLTRRDELRQRVIHGKDIIMKHQDSMIDGTIATKMDKFYKEIGFTEEEEIGKMLDCFKDDSVADEAAHYKKWLLDKEDNFFKAFIDCEKKEVKGKEK